MKFNTAKQMLDYINSNHDLYSSKAEIYVFNYNEAGSIATYHITKDEGRELSNKVKSGDEDYWATFLGVGGSIWDDPSHECYQEGQMSNLDRCEELLEFEDWILTEHYLIMKKAVLFDDFSFCCPFFNSKVGNGYGCDNPAQEETDIDAEGKEYGQCYYYSCPLGIEAEQEDFSRKDIDWDGLCECGEVTESEYLLVDVGDEATEDQKNALYSYERYIHRYDKKWLDKHNIPNSLVE